MTLDLLHFPLQHTPNIPLQSPSHSLHTNVVVKTGDNLRWGQALWAGSFRLEEAEGE